jgi:hypothetical protein
MTIHLLYEIDISLTAFSSGFCQINHFSQQGRFLPSSPIIFIEEDTNYGLFNESCGIYTMKACTLPNLHRENNQVIALDFIE